MKEWCKNGMQHLNGKRKFEKLTDGLCAECLQRMENVKPKSNGNQIRELISGIRLDKEQTDGKFDLRFRIAFLKIDELGGYLELKDAEGNPLYQNDREFLEHEFPEFNFGYVQLHRSVARYEQLFGLPVGTYPTKLLQPFRQFRIQNPRGVLGKGTHRNAKGEAKAKEVWAVACELAGSDRPKQKHLDEAFKKCAAEGKAKPGLVTRTTMDAQRHVVRKTKQQEEKGEMEAELEQYKHRCLELERELEEARQTILALQYKLRQQAYPAAV